MIYDMHIIFFNYSHLLCSYPFTDILLLNCFGQASTVDRRDLMIRPGVRCTQSLPQGVETIAMDCIGRVVQLTTHARAIFGISIDDRVAAIYPFEYKDGYKDKGLRNNRYALGELRCECMC